MAWLPNWSKRIKLTIDNTNVDDTLTDFPVLIKISNSSGISSTDVISVFTELGSDVNRKKIAVTTGDETTQCYVEIERFDYANSVAWLWVKVPSVASDAETILYVYYDSLHADNTAYIGDTTDAVTHNVWDVNFVAVFHMTQDPNGDVANAIKDSTSNQNDGTPAGGMTSADLVDGKVGKAIDFDGDNDCVGISDDPTLDIIGNITLECIMYSRDAQAGNAVQPCGKYNYALNFDHANEDFKGAFNIRDSVNAWWNSDGPDIISENTHHYFAGRYDGTDMKSYLDKAEGTTRVVAGKTIGVNNYPFWIGANDNGTGSAASFFNGIIGEIRISNISRSAAWLKATYYSNWDELVSFELEVPIGFTFSNPIPTNLSTTYGTNKQLQLTTTISGIYESYIYDVDFYDGFGVQVGTTVLGINSGSPVNSNAYLPTPSGVDYNWYVVATSSGSEGTSSTYTFSNRFLYDGYITENDSPVSRIVRLYYRDTGELIDSTTSSGGSNGYYSFDALINDEHFIVAFDDEAGEDYNALILDRLLPNGE